MIIRSLGLSVAITASPFGIRSNSPSFELSILSSNIVFSKISVSLKLSPSIVSLFPFCFPPSSISRSLKELDTSIFSQDHGWRNIIAALNDGGNEFNPFRRIALVKYMQYLSSRQDIIKYLYSEKKKLEGGKQNGKSETIEGESFKDTLIFENTIFEPNIDNSKDGEFERMPKGEAVIATLKPKERIIIMLSKHKCEIEANGQIFFIDQAGRKHVLDLGRNTIGRDASGTVVIEPGLRDVSRMHLVIENLGDNSLQLTDLSSHGTYIPSALLEDHTT